jgi:hypothetical protein
MMDLHKLHSPTNMQQVISKATELSVDLGAERMGTWIEPFGFFGSVRRDPRSHYVIRRRLR